MSPELIVISSDEEDNIKIRKPVASKGKIPRRKLSPLYNCILNPKEETKIKTPLPSPPSSPPPKTTLLNIDIDVNASLLNLPAHPSSFPTSTSTSIIKHKSKSNPQTPVFAPPPPRSKSVDLITISSSCSSSIIPGGRDTAIQIRLCDGDTKRSASVPPPFVPGLQDHIPRASLLEKHMGIGERGSELQKKREEEGTITIAPAEEAAVRPNTSGMTLMTDLPDLGPISTTNSATTQQQQYRQTLDPKVPYQPPLHDLGAQPQITQEIPLLGQIPSNEKTIILLDDDTPTSTPPPTTIARSRKSPFSSSSSLHPLILNYTPGDTGGAMTDQITTSENLMMKYPFPHSPPPLPATGPHVVGLGDRPYHRNSRQDEQEQEQEKDEDEPEQINGPYFSARHNQNQHGGQLGSVYQSQLYTHHVLTPSSTRKEEKDDEGSSQPQPHLQPSSSSPRSPKRKHPSLSTSIIQFDHLDHQQDHQQDPPLPSPKRPRTLSSPPIPPPRRPRSRPWTSAMIADMAQTLQFSFPFAEFSAKHGKAPAEVFEAFSAVVQMPLFEYSAKGMARARMKGFQERIRDYRDQGREIWKGHRREEKRRRGGGRGRGRGKGGEAVVGVGRGSERGGMGIAEVGRTYVWGEMQDQDQDQYKKKTKEKKKKSGGDEITATTKTTAAAAAAKRTTQSSSLGLLHPPGEGSPPATLTPLPPTLTPLTTPAPPALPAPPHPPPFSNPSSTSTSTISTKPPAPAPAPTTQKTSRPPIAPPEAKRNQAPVLELRDGIYMIVE